jgi:hypothetical protein
MRLFLLGVLVVAVFLNGCRKEDVPASAGALRVSITYATFQPRCLTLAVVDREDPSRSESTEVSVEPDTPSDQRTVAILGREGWSRSLTLTARAHERSCNGPLVAEQSVEARVPVEGVTDARLDLRAEDLDGDGYVSARGARPGTDCDDDDAAVHPGATEVCDGIDNNCVNGEADAPEGQSYYADADGDGYAAPDALPLPACVPPAGTATRRGDCDDGDPDIRPDQPESRCDGVDEDCDGIADDDAFAVGTSCTTALGCPGVTACQGVSATACVSTQQPVAWYVDEDGDGKAGAAAGSRCTAPVPGATSVREDCDESSRFASTDATDGCDRLDNDCDGAVDEDAAGCAGVDWREDVVGGASARWNAVAPYGARRGWLAGAGQVIHVSGATFEPVEDCDGTWLSAWAASTGRVFLGSSAGELATVRPDALASCERRSGPGTAALNGLVGFEQGDTVRLFAVDSQGRVLRWDYVEGASPQAAPQVVTRVAANLRAIHGLGPETLLAVGSELDGGVERPVAWRAPASGSTWRKEALGVPARTGYLRAVRVLTPRLAYAAGDGHLLLERSGTEWTARPGPTPGGGDLRGLLAFGRSALYVVSSDANDVHFFDGTAWRSVRVASSTLNALAGTGPDDLWGAGLGGVLLRWQP